jgi:hypothetical protein
MPKRLRYYLQNRYQDSGWMTLADEEFEYCGDAICRASELSDLAVAYGMVRVVDQHTGKVIREYPSGPKK